MARAPFQVLIFPFSRTDNGGTVYALFRRAKESYWQGVAGGGEDDERPEQAARRELWEEARISSTDRLYRLSTKCTMPVSDFDARDTWPADLYVIPQYYFGVDVRGREFVLSSEHSESCWVDFERAMSMLRWSDNQTALWELNERLTHQDLPVPEPP